MEKQTLRLRQQALAQQELPRLRSQQLINFRQPMHRRLVGGNQYQRVAGGKCVKQHVRPDVCVYTQGRVHV